MRSFLVFVFNVFICAAYTTQIRQHCIVQPDGTEKCNNVPALLTSLRIGSAPCLKLDFNCWSFKAMEYTNEIRIKFNVKRMLIPGPLRQLDNAIRYAGVLYRRGGKLRHQKLGRVTKEVRCKRWISGENIAWNYARGDVAKACVLQWLHSKKHRENLVRGWFREVAIGFHFGRFGKVYCVQTFSVIHKHGTFGSLREKRCKRIAMKRGRKKPGRKSKKKRKRKSKKTKRKTKKKGGRKSKGRGGRKKHSKPVSEPPAQEKLTDRSRDQGNRSCRCLQVGKDCWSSLAEETGNRCKPFIPAAKQPQSCKKKCCQYCQYYADNPVCKSTARKKVC